MPLGRWASPCPAPSSQRCGRWCAGSGEDGSGQVHALTEGEDLFGGDTRTGGGFERVGAECALAMAVIGESLKTFRKLAEEVALAVHDFLA